MPTPRTRAAATKSAAGTRRRTTTPPPTPAEIADRAYSLFLERGSTHGHDWDDWLQAERELSVSTGKTGTDAR